MYILTPKHQSKPVTDFSFIKKDAEAMHHLLLTYVSPTGKGPASHYAIHHSQFAKESYDFFVINPMLVGAKEGEIIIAINPRIVEKWDRSLSREGCMSFPFRHGVSVWRFNEIKVEYEVPNQDEKLITKKETVKGLIAHIFQHESEHARGAHIYLNTNSH